MANKKSTPAPAADSVTHYPSAEPSPQSQEPAFERFEHFGHFKQAVNSAKLPGAQVREFAERVADIAAGTKAVMQVALDDQQRAELRATSEGPSETLRPLLEANQVWAMQRLALVALKSLGEDAEELMGWAYRVHTPEGRAEEGRA